METIYDLIGIGIGPFNLGLAALLDSITSLNCLFIDQNPFFDWHSGMMVPGARMQVPFYADLVTLADPCSPYSFLNYLHSLGRHLLFANNENNYPLRKEFNDYYHWTARQLNSLRFGLHCENVSYQRANNCYEITALHVDNKKTEKLFARKLVIGTGHSPYIPPFLAGKMPLPGIIHSSGYMHQKKTLIRSGNATVIGSGQSAAEIFLDLLNDYPKRVKKLSWFSRSYFAPMDASKFTIELTTPAYVNYFYHLPAESKIKILSRQGHFYKGISKSTLDAIADKLYMLSAPGLGRLQGIHIQPNCELTDVCVIEDSGFELAFKHHETGNRFSNRTAAVVLATGYRNRKPGFLNNLNGIIAPDEEYLPAEDYSIDDRHSIFLQNADLYTHGFNSADLELGPYRNAVIINSILGHRHYHINEGKGFQSF